MFFFLLEKLSLRKKDLFDRKRELDLKGTGFKRKRTQRGNKRKSYIFSTQANRINILRSLYDPRGSISN